MGVEKLLQRIKQSEKENEKDIKEDFDPDKFVDAYNKSIREENSKYIEGWKSHENI